MYIFSRAVYAIVLYIEYCIYLLTSKGNCPKMFALVPQTVWNNNNKKGKTMIKRVPSVLTTPHTLNVGHFIKRTLHSSCLSQTAARGNDYYVHAWKHIPGKQLWMVRATRCTKCTCVDTCQALLTSASQGKKTKEKICIENKKQSTSPLTLQDPYFDGWLNWKKW